MKKKNLDSLLRRVEASQTNQSDDSIVNINDALSKSLKKGGYNTNNGHCHSGYNSSCGNAHCAGSSNGSCSNTSCLI
jgi:hypothetical protein